MPALLTSSFQSLRRARRHAAIAILALLCNPVVAEEHGAFPGWQAMRVIEQEGRPAVLRRADLDGDGRHELVVVNTRHSRLDLYRWLPPDERRAAKPDPERPNDLPMAPEFRREELPLEYLPLDVAAEDLDGDGRPELTILVAPPNKILIYGREQGQREDGKWSKRTEVDLLAGDLAPADNGMLVRRFDDRRELLIGMNDGIQRLAFGFPRRPDDAPPRVDWMSPRERRGRVAWWLADLDGDGDEDLVEQSRKARETVRWYACADDGSLRPAQVLFDRAIAGAGVLARPDDAAQLLLLDTAADGLVRRYALRTGEAGPLGRRWTLAVAGAATGTWCGIDIDGAPALIAVDPAQPRLLCTVLGDHGWQPQQTFPSISKIRAIAAPTASPGTVLLWAKGAGALQVSRWEGGRLTYPKPLPPHPVGGAPREALPEAPGDDADDPAPSKNAASAKRRILALGSAGPTTWWVQQVGEDLDLYLWAEPGRPPHRQRYAAVGADVDEAVWLGADRLLIKRKHERNAQLATLGEAGARIEAPAHLERRSLAQYRVVFVDGAYRPARLADGALQWLDENLHSIDQIMLDQGQKLTDYASTDARRGWAIQEDGQFIHQLETDDRGLVRMTHSIRIWGGSGIVHDPVLGIVLVAQDRVSCLRDGRPIRLELIDSIDQRVGRPSGLKKANIHRIGATDLTGNGRDEVLLYDHRRHHLTVLRATADGLKPAISWPVFEDRKYPYGGDEAPVIAEPRVVLALDIDGDARQDLALACHDRLVIYLGQGEPGAHARTDGGPHDEP